MNKDRNNSSNVNPVNGNNNDCMINDDGNNMNGSDNMNDSNNVFTNNATSSSSSHRGNQELETSCSPNNVDNTNEDDDMNIRKLNSSMNSEGNENIMRNQNSNEIIQNHEENEDYLSYELHLSKSQRHMLIRRLPIALPGKTVDDCEEHLEW